MGSSRLIGIPAIYSIVAINIEQFIVAIAQVANGDTPAATIEARLHILRAWPAKNQARATQDRNVGCHRGIVESSTVAFKLRRSFVALRLRTAVDRRRAPNREGQLGIITRTQALAFDTGASRHGRQRAVEAG